MRRQYCATLILVALICLTSCATASDILVICPTASYSHQQPFLLITQALLQRNHSVTLLTCNPEKIKPHENLTIVDWSFTYDLWKTTPEFNLQERKSQWQNVRFFSTTFSTKASSLQWAHKNTQQFIQNIISTNKTFDLMIEEGWGQLSFLGLLDMIGNPPLVLMSTAHSFSFTSLPFNNPENPSYVPVIWTGNTDTMSFWQRVTNTIQYMEYYWLFMHTLDLEDQLRLEYLDSKYIKRSLREIFEDSSRNSFISSFDSRITNYVRPVQPKIVEVGPLHLIEPKPLDQKLQAWLNDAPEGVIYFSLGSNMRGSSMGDFRRNAFLKAFARLPQYRVLWKWETEDVMQGQPENVLLRKWMPQQDVLAHPKVKVFIMQGGLQSLQEAYHYGVKLICIPMFGDQDLNCQRVNKIKTGISLEFNDLNEENIYQALKTVLEDHVYSENMAYYSALSKDTPMGPKEKSMWWIEYVLRHKGVAHLHSGAADLSLIQYYLLDVIVFLVSILISMVALIYLISRRIVCALARVSTSIINEDEQKKKKVK
uniref:UDP-glucuronosyltransferase 2B30 n=1 Tax=Cacopsylla melanoneura TaxID=428564 RepID=A0A8D8V7F4_9HEMI